MLQIKKYDLVNLDASAIEKKIFKKLEDLEKTKKFENFFVQLNKVINSEVNFSFVKASHETLKKLIRINTHINVEKKEVEMFKIIKNKEYYTLNDILEIILGYHLESRTQTLKKFIKNINLDNCVYCLAQYTTAYGINNKKIYIKGNLDHIYPKSSNALVSLSINNLVPVCVHCNQRKLDADEESFDFNPFESIQAPVFKFKDVIMVSNGNVQFKDIKNLKIDDINTTLEKRLDLTSLYREYRSPIENLLGRYKKFNSSSYESLIKNLVNKGVSTDLEYFISEIPYTEENIKNVPLHKFKSDFYKELEEYKKNGKIKFI